MKVDAASFDWVGLLQALSETVGRKIWDARYGYKEIDPHNCEQLDVDPGDTVYTFDENEDRLVAAEIVSKVGKFAFALRDSDQHTGPRLEVAAVGFYFKTPQEAAEDSRVYIEARVKSARQTLQDLEAAAAYLEGKEDDG